MELSKDQELAIKKLLAWWDDIKANGVNEKNQVFYLAGWAGTGKTTIANVFSDTLPKETKFRHGSFTGKAALRMRQAGMKSAQTLHSMIYRLIEADKYGRPSFELDPNSNLKRADILVLDECSMVDGELGKDVISFNIPILVLGDKGQLPPIKGAGFFTERKPNAILNEVHRQALENPIIQLATDIRLTGLVRRFDESNLITFPKNPDSHMFDAEQIICGKNKTRWDLNTQVRDHFDFSSGGDYPLEGERIICLRNNRKLGIFNGMIGTMISDAVNNGFISLSFIDDEDKQYDVDAHPEGFDDEEALVKMEWDKKKYSNDFTWGYAITGHKSQGSQWDSVFVYDDKFLVWDKENRTRWLYTCVTRAAEKLVLYRK